MTTRQDIASLALSRNGEQDGGGYGQPTVYNGHTNGVYDCLLFCCWVYRQLGVPLPSVQGGYPDGGAYVPYMDAYAVQHGATRPSWEAQPGDLVLFNWLGDSQPIGSQSHVEIVTGWTGGVMYSVGADSGPSNIDGFKGDGGVHRHWWPAPAGQGNPQIQHVVDTSKLVTFGATPAPAPAPRPKLVPVRTTADLPDVDPATVDMASPAVRLLQFRLGQHGGWIAPTNTDRGVLHNVIGWMQDTAGIAKDYDCGPTTWGYVLANPVR